MVDGAMLFKVYFLITVTVILTPAVKALCE